MLQKHCIAAFMKQLFPRLGNPTSFLVAKGDGLDLAELSALVVAPPSDKANSPGSGDGRRYASIALSIALFTLGEPMLVGVSRLP